MALKQQPLFEDIPVDYFSLIPTGTFRYITRTHLPHLSIFCALELMNYDANTPSYPQCHCRSSPTVKAIIESLAPIPLEIILDICRYAHIYPAEILFQLNHPLSLLSSCSGRNHRKCANCRRQESRREKVPSMVSFETNPLSKPETNANHGDNQQ